jgi:hypothetical protein
MYNIHLSRQSLLNPALAFLSTDPNMFDAYIHIVPPREKGTIAEIMEIL